jgi:hypothetical protein
LNYDKAVSDTQREISYINSAKREQESILNDLLHFKKSKFAKAATIDCVDLTLDKENVTLDKENRAE